MIISCIICNNSKIYIYCRFFKSSISNNCINKYFYNNLHNLSGIRVIVNKVPKLYKRRDFSPCYLSLYNYSSCITSCCIKWLISILRASLINYFQQLQWNETLIVLIVVVIVIVVGGNEEIILLQKVGYVLANRGADQETEHDTADDTQEAEWSSFWLGQDRPGWCGYHWSEKRPGYYVRFLNNRRAIK